MARLVDRLDHIHLFQRPVVTRDLADPRELDLNTCYACVAGTRKHVGTSFVQPEHVDEAAAMLHLIADGEERWRARPFVSMSNCFVVPPLKFATDACRCLEAGVRAGMPVLLLAAGQAGATSPAALAGAVVQEVAEVLAALVYVNLIVPGHPALFGPRPFVSVLRTVRGIEVSEDSVSVDAIRDVCTTGPGHFLGHERTLQLMQTEYLYPEVADRSS